MIKRGTKQKQRQVAVEWAGEDMGSGWLVLKRQVAETDRAFTSSSERSRIP